MPKSTLSPQSGTMNLGTGQRKLASSCFVAFCVRLLSTVRYTVCLSFQQVFNSVACKEVTKSLKPLFKTTQNVRARIQGEKCLAAG
jgi:hypothetical protein